MPTREEWLAGVTAEGRRLPVAKVAAYRAQHGIPHDPEPWDITKPSRGLGDTVAKITHATGIDTAVKAIAPKGCGCAGRQQKLNELVPFPQPEAE